MTFFLVLLLGTFSNCKAARTAFKETSPASKARRAEASEASAAMRECTRRETTRRAVPAALALAAGWEPLCGRCRKRLTLRKIQRNGAAFRAELPARGFAGAVPGSGSVAAAGRPESFTTLVDDGDEGCAGSIRCGVSAAAAGRRRAFVVDGSSTAGGRAAAEGRLGVDDGGGGNFAGACGAATEGGGSGGGGGATTARRTSTAGACGNRMDSG